MGATDEYRLRVINEVRGDAELRRQEQALNRMVESTERGQGRLASSYASAQRTAEQALKKTEDALARAARGAEDTSARFRNAMVGLASAVLVGREAIDTLSGAMERLYKSTLSSDAALSRTLGTYRALRLAAAVPAGAGAVASTAGTIAAVYAVETTIRATNELARQVQAIALRSAGSGNSFESTYSLQRAGAVTGRDLGFLSGRSSEEIREIAEEMRQLEDPVIRAAYAYREFGKDAGKALENIDGRLLNAISSADELAGRLDGPTRAKLSAFERFWSGIHPFDEWGDMLDDFIERSKIKLAVFAVDAAKILGEAARESRGFVNVGPDQVGSNDLPFGMTREPLSLPTDDQFARGAREALAEQLAGRNVGGFVFQPGAGINTPSAAARRALQAYENGPAGARDSLSAAESRFANIRKLAAASTESMRALLSDQVLQEDRAVKSAEARVKALEEQVRLAERLEQVTRALVGIEEKYLYDPKNTLSRLDLEQSAFLRDVPAGAAGADIRRRAAAAFTSARFQATNTLLNPGQGEARALSALSLLPSAPSLYGALGIEARSAEGLPSVDDNLKRGQEALVRLRQLGLDSLKSYTDYQARLVELTAGPGGEADAVRTVTQMRLDALEKQRQYGVEDAELARQRIQIERDGELRLLELQQRRRQEARNAIGQSFDALVASGSGGIGALVRSVGLSQVRTLAQNAGENLYSSAGSLLGRIGQASGFGGLLRGTLFDPANASPVQKNIDALDRNTLALERFGAAGGGSRSGGGGLIGAVRSLFGGGSAESALNGISNSASAARNLGMISLGLGGGVSALDLYQTTAAGNRNLRTASAISGLPLNTSSAAGRAGLGANVTRGIGYAAAGAGAVFGAIDGFSRGGAQGALQGSASVLGGLALIPGPQQPFLAAAALITGLGSMLFGDPKKRRDSELNRLISDAAYTEPTATDYTFDTSGRLTDYNRRGDLRSLPPIQVNVTTMDSKSFVDHAEDISNAVQQGILDGHSLVRTIQQEAFAL